MPSPHLQTPLERNGYPTFGCFNNLTKISSLTIRLWCRLLCENPDARIFLKAKQFQSPEVQHRFLQIFNAYGIAQYRIALSGHQPYIVNHLNLYGQIDVALDTAPYAGTTTTCEALYMGVPVITLRGEGIHAQNVGCSLLTAVNLENCIALNEDEYVQKASILCRNRTQLSALRAGLRTRMLCSDLCNRRRHTVRLERLYASIARTGRHLSNELATTDAAHAEAQ